MTERIDAIELHGVGDNPFLLQLERQKLKSLQQPLPPTPSTAKAEAVTTQAIPVEPQSSAQSSEDNEVAASANRWKEVKAPWHGELNYQQRYLDWIIARARRQYYVFQNYAMAEDDFQRFFRYLKLYGYANWRFEWFQAMCEMNWLMLIQDRRKEATRTYNQQLQAFLEEAKKQDKSQSQTLVKYIEHLQAEERLPDTQHLDTEVEPKELARLAKQMVAHGERDLAVDVLNLAQVKQAGEQFNTAKLIEAIRNPHAQQADLQAVIQAMIVPKWLPYAPTQGPVPLDQTRLAQHGTQDVHIFPLEKIDLIQPAHPYGQDPNQGQPQHDQQQGRRPAKTERNSKEDDARQAAPNVARKPDIFKAIPPVMA